ncbi:hypothetical protein TPY_0380 [Sulfobacillus acidophilus TPY]|uniref:Haloacid dehalogenase domain protein hydrolase n=1 Tax=Sulfobacillus acidophilus (strain ATCC 700253 / DSM 10332 / NAL) TaxID=679936 RepID=G8TXL6_SULAD|nr:hypothetical protein TPY_0380 [Sulfobacillus acidophilus TPY]AEW03915.1 Haloacid dehalogenase domain protein hydrolase [Sulfobacillus acidophilus DSM 10332]
MWQAVGLDLDDTLLELDGDFLSRYLTAFESSLQSALAVRDPLHPIWGDIMKTILAQPNRADFLYNQVMTYLLTRLHTNRDALDRALTRFYQEEFSRLRQWTRPRYGMNGLLAAIRGRGVRVALVTSPWFPRRAIEERLEWAGLEGFPFDLVTAMEEMHATKPEPQYYREVADKVGIRPEQWIMVGNDVDEDILPALSVGMKAFWITNGQTDPRVPSAVPRGTIYDAGRYLLSAGEPK